MSKAIFPALAILAMAYSALAATPAKTHKRHHTLKAASTTSAHKHTTTASRTASSKHTRAEAARSTRRRKGRPHRAASHYQQVPTPDRYREIQEALASKGYFHGDANGEWGPDSIDAMKRFQADQNLMPDGKINSLSLIALGLGPKHLTAKSETEPQSRPALPDVSPGSESVPLPAPPPAPPR